jgi:hypothetical protein
VTNSDWFQLVGGLFEVIGLITVALGISDARARFTDRPSLPQKIRNVILRLTVKLGLRKGKVIEPSASGTVHSSGSARLMIGYGFLGTLEERVTRLQEIAQKHEDAIDGLAGQLQDESAARKQADDEALARLTTTEQQLEQRISEAAAGGITLEAWGVLSFAVGVVLTTVGGIAG